MPDWHYVIWRTGRSPAQKPIPGLDYPSLEAVVRVYLDEHSVDVEDGCIAIACPITGDWGGDDQPYLGVFPLPK
ncbi:Glucokinase [Raoultella terrigena]|uniref:Glucokinase n=1 Tax=Raoultella terrigena TaxID=577 RepID=A0A4U9D4R8_RAOTE|nr:Glucokinase [Raoultella terrigena]